MAYPTRLTRAIRFGSVSVRRTLDHTRHCTIPILIPADAIPCTVSHSYCTDRITLKRAMSMSNTAHQPAAAAKESKDIWNPTQYLLYDEMRARPAVDLQTRLLQTLSHFGRSAGSIARIVDLGCGPGQQVFQLLSAFPAGRVTGVDSSQNMLQRAKETAEQKSKEIQQRVTWKLGGFQEFTDSAGVDLIFSNAALHWDPASHPALFPHLLRQLRPGGILAVQMPNNFRAPSHINMRRALEEGKFLTPERLEEVWAKQPDVHIDGAAYYYHLLRPHAQHVDVWQVEYQQPIASSTKYHPVLEWTKSTALAPILAALESDADRVQFQDIYSRLLEESYPYFEGKNGRQVLFPFKRIFMIALV